MRRIWGYLTVTIITMFLTGGVVSLLMNIRDRKEEEKVRHIDVVPLAEEDVDPAIWGHNYPREYEAYKRTSDVERTRYGGSEAFSKLDEDSLKAISYNTNGRFFEVKTESELSSSFAEIVRLKERLVKIELDTYFLSFAIFIFVFIYFLANTRFRIFP